MMSQRGYEQYPQHQRMPCLPSTAQWYVIHSQPLKERSVAIALQQQCGVATYLPEIKQAVRGKIESSPLFPGYLFALVDLHHTPSSHINTTPGVVRLMTIDAQPQPVPESIITTLQRQIEQLNTAGGFREPTLQPGDAVEIQDGPLCGLVATFVGPTTPRARVRVLLEMLGRLNEVEIDRASLQPASSKPPRRTRGRGRTIRTPSR